MEKNLGHATAYGYAKSKGYSGTEEEFAELMADYASVGQSAAQSAEQAAASATSASGSAATATQAAQTATSKASEAVTAAGTATTKASEANQSATSASQSAESAGTSAQTATTAASTATTKASKASESAATATAAKTDAETARDAAAQSASEAAASAESIDPDEFDRKIYAAFATDAASGSIASFADGADSIPMKDVLVHIEPVQEGSGDPSPDNVRPITGWTGAKVTRTGKNLIDANTVWEAYLQTDGTFYQPLGITHWNIPAKFVGKQLTFSAYAKADGSDANIRVFANIGGSNKNGTLINNTQSFELTELTFTPTSTSDYISLENGGINGTYKDIQLELGSTATDYEPYAGQTYDTTFPTEAGTVYGGTLDVTKGELVVDRAIWTGNTADMNNNNEDYPGWKSARIKDIVGGGVNAGVYNAITNISPATASGNYAIGINTISSSNVGVLWLSKPYFNKNQTEWKALALDVQVFLPLATPITYQLTPQEITSLLGTNNLWADTGDSEVEYRANTELWVQRKITEAVAAVLNS